MEPFEEAVKKGDAAAVRALSKQPELRAAIDRPAIDSAPAIVFSRHDRPVVDVTRIIVALAAAFAVAACTSPAVSKAVGTGTDGATPIVVRTSESAVAVENHSGRDLLNVRITLAAGDAAKPFILVVPTIAIGATSEQPLAGFRSEDGTMLDPAIVHPTQATITARDTLAKSYEVTVLWKR
jgi:hypothetical protein